MRLFESGMRPYTANCPNINPSREGMRCRRPVFFRARGEVKVESEQGYAARAVATDGAFCKESLMQRDTQTSQADKGSSRGRSVPAPLTRVFPTRRSGRSTRLGGMLLLPGLLLFSGCKGNPFSFTMDVVTIRLAQSELAELEPHVLGMAQADVDTVLGKRNDTLEPLDGKDRWILYPSIRNPRGETFVVARVTPDNRIGQVGLWKRNRDGILDIWQTKRMLQKCFTLTPEECRQAGDLDEPLREFVSLSTRFRAVFYDFPSRIPGSGAKYLILCFNDQDLCVEVRTVGLLAQGQQIEPDLEELEAPHAMPGRMESPAESAKKP